MGYSPAPLESNEMAKRWVLDTDTKGTGARMVPLEDTLKKPEPQAPAPKPAPAPAKPALQRPVEPKPKKQVVKRSTPLPAGHVRKKSTGEIGKVKAVDPRAGTITVTWLHGGQTSTVPISSVTRK
jgi:hypothetical protein